MCLLRKITYGEFSEFVREKKITYKVRIEKSSNQYCLHFFLTLTLILAGWKVWPMLKFFIIERTPHVCNQQNKIVLAYKRFNRSCLRKCGAGCTCSSAWPIFVQIIYALYMCLNISVAVNEGRPPLFRNKRFALNEMFQRNTSKFAIFYV